MEKFVMLIHLQSALSALLTRLRNWIERQQFVKGPAADGEPGQVLATNGEGVRSWTTVEASGAAAAAEKAANEYTDKKIAEIHVPDVTEQIEQALAEAKESGEYFAKNTLILESSTSGSTKRFRIDVDDSGTLTATEVT